MDDKLKQILERRLRIPMYQEITLVAKSPTATATPIKQEIIELNDVLWEIIEDFKTIQNNGSIALRINSHYSNSAAIEETKRILGKYETD